MRFWCTFYTQKLLCFHFELHSYLCFSFNVYHSWKKTLFIFPNSSAQICGIVLTQVKSRKFFNLASRARKPFLIKKFKFSNSLLRLLWWKPKIESSPFVLDYIIPYIEQTRRACSKFSECFPLLVVFLSSTNTARAPKLCQMNFEIEKFCFGLDQKLIQCNIFSKDKQFILQ